MTAIAYRDGVMAADTGVWYDSQFVCGHIQKIRRLEGGALLAMGGGLGFGEWFAKHLNPDDPWSAHASESAPEVPPESFAAILVTPNGDVWRYNGSLLPFRETGSFCATGAGSAVGILTGAMAAGATAEEAIWIAMRHCDSAAGNVQVERLNAD